MLPTKLYHYSYEPVEFLVPDYHEKDWERSWPLGKPSGLWFSVEDYEDDQNWKTWCQSEGYALDNLRCRHQLILKNDAKILHIWNSTQLEQFGLKYSKHDAIIFESRKMLYAMGEEKKPYIYDINWEPIKKEYDGIIIAPYQWSCRITNPSTSWYYGWDCASGCIWNIEAIESLILVERLEVQEGENEMDSQSEECSQHK